MVIVPHTPRRPSSTTSLPHRSLGLWRERRVHNDNDNEEQRGCKELHHIRCRSLVEAEATINITADQLTSSLLPGTRHPQLLPDTTEAYLVCRVCLRRPLFGPTRLRTRYIELLSKCVSATPLISGTDIYPYSYLVLNLFWESLIVLSLSV